MKRKRTSAHAAGRAPKRARDAADQSASATTPAVDHPVLSRLYPHVVHLRHYLLSRLPASSKNRRRKLAQLGLQKLPGQDATATQPSDGELAKLLDSVVVGGCLPTTADAPAQQEAARERDHDLESYSQQLPTSTAINTASTFKPGYFLQSEIVDFVIWRLFRRSTSHMPSHLLCHGFQRPGSYGQPGPQAANHCIPGLVSHDRNSFVETLKGPLWCQLHALLGPGGDLIIMDMLSDCGIFSPIEGGRGNFVQLSGIPLSELKPVSLSGDAPASERVNNSTCKTPHALVSENRSPSEIRFVRYRMLYAAAAVNAKGGVRFGMRHLHVLNLFPDLKNQQQTIHILRYIFPRQHGLHNVFTSKVDKLETSLPFKDYTLREKELHLTMCRDLPQDARTPERITKWKTRVPKRLRGETIALVEKLRKLHKQCPYTDLLRHYCPVEGVHLSSKPAWRKGPIQPKEIGPAAAAAVSSHCDKENESAKLQNTTVEQNCFTDMACPTAHISAFCRAVMARVIPNAFWGSDHNRHIVLFWVDQFVCLRRFESLTLHQVTQSIQIATLAWLRTPGQDATTKMAKPDFDKRRALFLEFVYWVFDSFLIPLIRSNFHVTESTVHRNRLFYFRHDVWRMLAKPSLSSMKLSMFEEVPLERATKLLARRPLGFSHVRLLPKSTGVRLITSLKRRQQIMRNGTTMLGRSINTVMTPAFNVLNYEKTLHPEKLGSSLFSVNDMLPKLTAFKVSLQSQGLAEQPLYFAKLDVQSCFDTIPQRRLLVMVDSLMSLQEYQTNKHVEISPMGRLQRLDGQYVGANPRKRYVAHSGAAKDGNSFGSLVQDKFVGAKTNTVFLNTAAHRLETKDDLMQLLREHVERNLFKIGKDFYRQKTGIPQGSVLSSILCNFFYAELEREVLSFALGNDCLLLRLLDDFCLITTQREHAEHFVRAMHRGHGDYGVVVKTSKSLVNFDMSIDGGSPVPKCVSEVSFPYCGVLINMHTLEVSRHHDRTGTCVADSLTVDLAKVPGQTLYRKALNAFKVQLQTMFIDTSLNSVPAVLANLHQSFYEAAVRCFEYARGLARPVRPSLLIKTVNGVIALAFVKLQRRTRIRGPAQHVEKVRSAISRGTVQWLACKAFDVVFQRRQTQHGVLLAWLRVQMAAIRPRSSSERQMLERAAAWRADGPAKPLM